MKRKLWLSLCLLCAVVLSNIPYVIAELCMHPNLEVTKVQKYYVPTEGGHDFRTDTYTYCPDCDESGMNRTAVYMGHDISFVSHWHVENSLKHAYEYTCYPCGFWITRYEGCTGDPCVVMLQGIGSDIVAE